MGFMSDGQPPCSAFRPSCRFRSPLRTVDASVTARHGHRSRHAEPLAGHRGLSASWAFISRRCWLTCMLLAVSFRWSGRRPGPAPIGYGADWQVELDRRGCIADGAWLCSRCNCARQLGRPLLTAIGASSPPALRSRGTWRLRTRLDNVQVKFGNPDGGQHRVHRVSLDPLPDGRYTCSGRDVTNEVRLRRRWTAASAASQCGTSRRPPPWHATATGCSPRLATTCARR